jgi:beta-galactosidase beta subunit
MPKPSKKVASIMILIGAITIAFIATDKIKNKELFNPNQLVKGDIKSNNPVKSIDEYMLAKFEESNPGSTDGDLPSTVTEFTIAQLFGKYEALKAQSLNTPENLDALTTALAQQTREFTALPTKYSILDLKTFPDYEKDKAKRYGNEFAKIMEKYIKQQHLIQESDSMKYVRAYATIKTNQSDALAKLEIPRSISDEHLEYTNDLTKVGIALVKLAETENDPVLSALLLKQYNEIRDRQPKVLIAISDYFIKNGIIFSDDEPGAMWNNI